MSILMFVDQLWTQGDTLIVNSTIWGTCGVVAVYVGVCTRRLPMRAPHWLSCRAKSSHVC